MTLTTTPGDPNADSYAAITDADAYFLALGQALWTATDAWKEVHLRRATRYLENQYYGRWIGIRAALTQSLQWPRVDGMRTLLITTITTPLIDPDGFQIPTNAIPDRVVKATCELAYLSLSGVPLEPAILAASQNIAMERLQVDVLQKQVQYVGAKAIQDRYLVVEGLLRGLVLNTPGAAAGNVQIRRA